MIASMTKTQAQRNLREYIDSNGINSVERFIAMTTPSLKFKTQALTWLEQMRIRTRKPVKPDTLALYAMIIHNWLIPQIGEEPLEAVGNGILKRVVAKFVVEGLAAETIDTYCGGAESSCGIGGQQRRRAVVFTKVESRVRATPGR